MTLLILPLKKVDILNRPTTKMVEYDRLNISTTNNISQSSKNVNIKNDSALPKVTKWYCMTLLIEKGTERTSAGTSKSPKTAFIPFDASDSISQSLKNVNIKNSENSKNKKYAVDYTIQDEKYDNIESLDKINEVGYGVVLSNAKGKRSSHINPNFVN